MLNSKRKSQSKLRQKKRKHAPENAEDAEQFEFEEEIAERPAKAAAPPELEAERPEETAAEKRLRLARAYFAKIGAEDEDGILLSDRLKAEAKEAAGWVVRRVAQHVHLDPLPATGECPLYGTGKLKRGHRLSATAAALSSTDSVAYTTTKCGRISVWDVESDTRTFLGARASQEAAPGADGVKFGAAQSSRCALCSLCVSSDDRYLAAGGTDKLVYVWDLRTGEQIKRFRGHKGIVAGVAFQHGTSQLFSASFDRSVKLWSLTDMAYLDTLYGHQGEIAAVDAAQQERCVTGGLDGTCRVWKIPEDSQLVYRTPTHSADCVRYVTGAEWVAGGYGGMLAFYTPQRKAPVWRGCAHGAGSQYAQAAGPGCLSSSVASWVQSIGVCPRGDILATGAGDGVIRVWRVAGDDKHRSLESMGGLPARGFVNGIAIARSGRFLVAAVGQEPRLGRWARDPVARNGTVLYQLGGSESG